jgi:hypothetical protein
MASHSQDNPHTKSTPGTSNSPKNEEVESLFPEIPYALPHKELDQFKRITRAYARQIGSLPLAPLLPHRKQVNMPVVDNHDQVFVHTVEDLIDFSLIEIEQPLNLIPETPAGNKSEPGNFESDEEGSNSDHSALELDDMEDSNDNNEEMRNQPQNNQPWLARDSLEILGWVHNLPQHTKTLLPKYDPEISRLPEDHIKNFILAIRLMNVQHEDVMYRIFPYTFENSASTWYFSFPVGSITSWTKFQKDFLDKFAEETTTGDLKAKLFTATMS